MKGTIEFRYDFDNDLVLAHPRWTLTTAADVIRWYDLHATYFESRFREAKDLITMNDAFDLAPPIAALWGSYRGRLHESLVRFSVGVQNNPRVRLTTNTSGARYNISSLEAQSLEDAMREIASVRESRADEAVRSVRSISTRMSVAPEIDRDASPAQRTKK